MTMADAAESGAIEHLLEIMRRLRAPQGGCPWDLEQTFDTIAPYTIEEAYEVADAIARKDMVALKDELGDLLFQSVYHAQMASESGAFDFKDVVRAICAKMIHRHPHVFGDAKVDTSADQTSRWEELKAKERGAKPGPVSALDGLPAGLPALKQAEKFQKRAARVGFDWPEAKQVLDKIDEEIDEIKQAMASNASTAKLSDEIGDLLFAVVNLARKAGIDPGMALRGTNLKFDRRFRRIEELLLAHGKKPEQSTLDEMEALWVKAKGEEAR
ncbi:MAG: nucleoside triphosphate pyrophosphohydrolase [Alphaproteobacteria bacterium]|nr:nucleoside triphosphate pyrophosphohydrolase [Alphaproteobacteria bacterium]